MRRYTLPVEALQHYRPLQPSTALQLYILYSIQPSTAPLSMAFYLLYAARSLPILSELPRGGRFNEGMFGVPLSGAHARFRVSVTNTRRSNVRTSCVYMYSKRGPGTDTDTSA